MARLGLSVQLTGDGFVASQDPPAGAALEPGTVARVVLSRFVKSGERTVEP
jgi:hypothetical protein